MPCRIACGAPVVMWVHGGGYAIGDKANQVDDKVSLFNAHGRILVSVNYRLTVARPPGTAVYPDRYQDVAASVAWVHSHIGDYGGDPTRIALLGHSTAEQANIPVTRIDARTLSHADVNRLIGAPGDTVMTEPITRFLTTCLAR